MLRPWSISTAVRNPERLRGFLQVLADMAGKCWRDCQADFQVRLIQRRLYGASSLQFYNGLSQEHVNLIESGRPISLQEAREIFNSKNYNDPSMRGRQSFKPLQRFGFASVENERIRITGMGKMLLADDWEKSDVFLRAMLKWQLPNPLDRNFRGQDGYNIKPFVGALRLMDEVNRLAKKNKIKAKGLSFPEFKVFALTLINWREIKNVAEEITQFRHDNAALSAAEREALLDSEAARLRPDFNMRHINDYADNALRYFRATGYVHLSDWGHRIVFSRYKETELASLFASDRGAPIIDFADLGGSYADYLTSGEMPDLPGERPDELRKAILFHNSAIEKMDGIKLPSPGEKLSRPKLRELRGKRQSQHHAIIRAQNKEELRAPDKVAKYVAELRELATRKNKRVDRPPPPVALEWLVGKALQALNDAKEIRPNYPQTDEDFPQHTAPGGVADIECYYDTFAATCEVTMMTGRNQWMHEHQPIMRHLFQFGKKNKKMEVYCLFIAPVLHVDSVNVFILSAAQGYEGKHLRIAPLSIAQFCDVMDVCVQKMRRGKNIKSSDVKALLDSLANSIRRAKTTAAWKKKAPNLIEQWKQSV